MRGAWDSLPAQDMLASDCSVYAQHNLAQPLLSERVVMASIARALSYQKSIAVALPETGVETIARMVLYLQVLKYEASEDHIRTPGLNAGILEHRHDLVLITRAKQANERLTRAKLRPWLLKTPTIRPSGGFITAVVDGSGDRLEIARLIETNTRPLALIIDGTRGGVEQPWHLDQVLYDYFRSVPRITLFSLGDPQAASSLRAQGTDSLVFQLRVEDCRNLEELRSTGARFQLGLIEDNQIERALSSITASYLELLRHQERFPDPILKERLSIVGKVFRTLNELSVPLVTLENAFQDAARLGPYPVKRLDRWLEISRQGACAHGDAETKLRALMDQVIQLYQTLLTGVSGKADWLIKRLNESCRSATSTLVLCGSPYCETALSAWCDRELGEDWRQSIRIVPMDGVKSFRTNLREIEQAIILGTLWPSRQYWLGATDAQVTIPIYASEQQINCSMLGKWWANHGAHSEPLGDKYRFWRLDWPSRRLTDPPSVGAVVDQPVIMLGKYGHYEKPAVVIAASLPPDVDDWLDVLLSEPVEPTRIYHEPGETLNLNRVFIALEETDEEIAWCSNKYVTALNLDRDQIEPTLPINLKAGQLVLLIKNSPERLATQERLFEIFDSGDGMQKVLQMSARWETLVEKVKGHLPFAEIKMHLKKACVEISDQTLHSWLKLQVYGPSSKNKDAIRVFAELAKDPLPEKNSGYIWKALEKLRLEHRRLGRQLREVLLQRRPHVSEINYGSVKLTSTELDELIKIATVREVRWPASQLRHDISPTTRGDEINENHTYSD